MRDLRLFCLPSSRGKGLGSPGKKRREDPSYKYGALGCQAFSIVTPQNFYRGSRESRSLAALGMTNWRKALKRLGGLFEGSFDEADAAFGPLAQVVGAFHAGVAQCVQFVGDGQGR